LDKTEESVNTKTWIIFAAVCVALLAGLVALSRGNQIDVSSVDSSKIVAASEQNGNIGDHVYGTTSGKATLIEYGDFQCPACQAANPNIKELSEEYKDKMVFIFRNLPLTSIHPNARAGAAAAEAAGLQDKYWEMHDLLYEQQDTWSNAASDKRLSYFVGYASQVGVKDIDKFKSDMESQAVSDKINFDMALAKKDDATATPALLLNGEKIESDVWRDKEKFKQKIEEALK
jgi:protein-disulfide isomerase